MAFIAAVALSLTGASALALSGANADEVKIKIFARQGGDWFRALYVKTDDNGVLEIKNVIPGKYKIEIRDKDIEDNQIVAGKFRMLDEDGKRIREKTDVDIYMHMNGTKTFVGTLETDEEGWLEMAVMVPDIVYELDVKDNASLSQKDGKYRIKINAKIDDSKWFRALYTRTDTDKILRVKDVPPGKYKFKYKTGDATPDMPFVLDMTLLNNDAERIDEETTVELYAYVGGQRALIGTMQTDDDGRVVIPGALTGVKYKVKVK